MNRPLQRLSRSEDFGYGGGPVSDGARPSPSDGQGAATLAYFESAAESPF